MKPKKAYILKTDHKKSIEYAADVARSCDAVNLKWEYVEWYQGQPEKGWQNTGVAKPKKVSGGPAAQCCFSGHIAIWKKILDSGEAGIALEHDGMMLHPIDIDIPDGEIVVLGYKLENPTSYNHKSAGPPVEIVDTIDNGHEGSHAYAITPATAKMLIDEVIENGAIGAIDNRYFLRSRKTKVGIKIMTPTPAIGWVRDSTIQAKNKSSSRNYPFIRSFEKYYDNKAKANRLENWPHKGITANIVSNDSSLS